MKLTPREVIEAEEKEALRELCVAFGSAMRHSFLNHKEKSEAAWRDVADKLYRFAKEY